MRVYIAAPYDCRPVAIEVMGRIEDAGHEVTSTWLRQLDTLDDEHARLDLADVDRADVLVALNPEDWHRLGAGRHTELGYAIAKGKRLLLVGSRSQIFHYLREVVVVPYFDDIVPALVAMTQPIPQEAR